MYKEILQKGNSLAFVVAISLILLAVIAQKSSFAYINSASEVVMAPLISSDSIKNLIIDNSFKDSSPKINTLKNQYLICTKIKKYYTDLGISYYANYYAFSICSILFLTLLTIAVFLIANQGWQNSSLTLKSFLLTTTVLSSIYYFLPNVLSNQENLKNNIEKVKAYEQIQFDMLSFVNRINEVDNKTIDSSISMYYARMSTNLDFLIKIDDSKLNSEMSDLLKSSKQK